MQGENQQKKLVYKGKWAGPESAHAGTMRCEDFSAHLRARPPNG